MIYVVKRFLREILIKCSAAQGHSELLVRHFGENQQMAEIGQKALIKCYCFLILFRYQLRQRMIVQE
ncbi:hypothetical protein D3C76_1562150 [compost metagenome]